MFNPIMSHQLQQQQSQQQEQRRDSDRLPTSSDVDERFLSDRNQDVASHQSHNMMAATDLSKTQDSIMSPANRMGPANMNHPAARQQVHPYLFGGTHTNPNYSRQCQILSPECLPPPASADQRHQGQIYQHPGHLVNYTPEANSNRWQQNYHLAYRNSMPPSYYSQPSMMGGSINHNNHMMISPQQQHHHHNYQNHQQPLNPSNLINYNSTITTPRLQQHNYLGGPMRHSLAAPSIIKPKNIDLQLCPMGAAGQMRPQSSSSYIDKCSLLPIQFVSPSATNNSEPNHTHFNYQTSSLSEPTNQRSNLVESNSSSSTSGSSSSMCSSSATAAANSQARSVEHSDKDAKQQQQQQQQQPEAQRFAKNLSSDQPVESGFRAYLTQLILASNVPFAYTIILVAFLITMIAATSIITILTIILTLTGYTAYPVTENTFNTSLAIGIVCASFALVLVTGSLIVWRRHCNAAYYYLDEPQDASRGTSSPQLSVTYDDSEYGSVPVNDWIKHVQKLHADSDIGFAREFEKIQQANQKQNTALTCDHSQLPENKHKNRYINIVAYDHTRVVLKAPLGGPKKPGYDYINANFIDGYNKPRAYIGTQGPLVSTFDDYWRMIWEQRVAIIVMITNLQERGRRKCDMYWPKEGTETYGSIQVKLLCEVVMATYTLRTFTVKNLKLKKRTGSERNVYQYHYTNWPDHGVPDHPLPVLSFVRKSAMSNPPGAGAIICHCSAGCGRSGTYIVIDAMLKQIRHKQSINVVDFLKHIRSQRNYLVQTEEQYIFIHDAIVEAIESGETEIPLHLIGKYIQMLQTGGGLAENGLVNGAAGTTKQLGSNYSLMNGLCQSPANNLSVTNDQQQLISTSNSNLLMANATTTTSTNALQKSSLANSQATTVSRSRSSGQWSLLERQYRLAVSFKAKDFCVVSALKPCNRNKNRTHDLIPLEAHRVHITPKPGADGSDYINATFLMGFNHLHEFIVTQHPIQETFSDFWQMVYDHNSRTIVLLTQMGAPNDPTSDNNNSEFPQFWPQKEDEVDYGSFKVKLIQESTLMKAENGGVIMTRDFIMRSNQDDYELQTRIIHCPGWPECCGPLSAVFDLIQVVNEAAQQASQNQRHADGGHQRSETVTVGQEHEPQNGGPIIVVDKFGGTEASTFAVLTTLFKQINYESHADVYMYAKLAHLRRPAIWPSQDDYLFLYRAIENYATNLLQKQQQQQASDSKQATAASLTAPISMANLHHHQTMTLDRHRAHKSSPSINKSSTMRRNTSSNQKHPQQQQQQPQQHQQASFVNYPTTPTSAPSVGAKHIMVMNNRQHTFGGGELVPSNKQQNQARYNQQQQQHQTLDHNHNTLQYSPALVMQVNSGTLMGGSNKQMPKGSPYNSAASIGAGSHQHLLATSATNGRPVAAVSSNQATMNQPDHYNLYSIQ